MSLVNVLRWFWESELPLRLLNACLSHVPVKSAVLRIYSSCLKSLTMFIPRINHPSTMGTVILSLSILIFAMNRHLVIENLSLRQQQAVMKRHVKLPTIRTRNRIFWAIVSNLWKDWKSALIIVQPDTVIRWHRKGFRLFWKFKSSRRRVRRPSIDSNIRRLIEDMAMANPLWGAPRIHGELMKLAIEVHERTVSKIIRKFRTGKSPSQTWRTFLKNHMHNTFAIDFFTVSTASFRVLYVCVIFLHKSRQVVHFDVTRNPTAKWTAQQIVEAFPWDTAPKYLLRDRDGIYSEYFRSRVKNLGLNEVKTAPQSP